MVDRQSLKGVGERADQRLVLIHRRICSVATGVHDPC